MKLGLTGGMGCGKSSALLYFAECGAAVVESDRIVRELLANDSVVHKDVRAAFGPEVFDSEGRPDHRAIARIVFADRSALERLEAILHPRVRATWKRRIEAEPERTAVVEIPLLFEKNLEKSFDFSLCVVSDAATARDRLAKRGLNEEEISLRIARQMPLSQKIALADFVILNNGSPEFLRRQVHALAEELASTEPKPSAFPDPTSSTRFT